MFQPNLNQNQQLPPKRQAIYYRPNDFFDSYQDSTYFILSNYNKSSQKSLIENLSILIGKIRQIKTQTTINPNKQNSMNDSLASLNKNILLQKKQISNFNTNQSESTNPQSEIRELVVLEKTGKKPFKSKKKQDVSLPMQPSSLQVMQIKKHQKLIQSMKKLSISGDFMDFKTDIQNYENNNRPLNIELPTNINNKNEPIKSMLKKRTQDTNLLKFDQQSLKDKSITQLLQGSKVKKRVQDDDQFDQDDGDYILTDHQSNQSSNQDGDYDQKLCHQNQAPIFGTIFSAAAGKNFLKGKNFFKKTSQQPKQKKLTFQPLLQSPKKSKTKKKRVYINKKKVPRWAEDLLKVQTQFKKPVQVQLRNQCHFNIGVCTIEYLRTNNIFHTKENYQRNSTARWRKRKDGYVV